MSKLDQYFRQSYDRIRSVAPPEGGWERIAAAKSTVWTTSSSAAIYWLYVSVLLVISAAGFYLYQRPDAGSTVSLRESVALSPLPTKSGDGAIVPNGSSENDLPVPQAMRVDAMPESDRSTVPRPEGRTMPTDPSSTASLSEPAPVRSAELQIDEGGRAWTPPPTNGIAAVVSELPVPPLPGEAFGAPKSLADSLPDIAPAVAGGGKPTARRPDAYWEIGVRGGAYFGFRRTPVSTYTFAESTAPRSQAFNVSDRTIYGEADGIFTDFSRRTLHRGYWGGGLTRQFATGLRLGVELLFEQERVTLYSDASELITDPVRGGFIIFEESWQEDWSINLAAGYTFRRKRRLQLYAGALLMSRFSRSGSTTDILVQIGEGERSAQGSDPVFERGFTGSYRVLPQVGVYYGLTANWRIGIETGPGIGLRAGYRF